MKSKNRVEHVDPLPGLRAEAQRRYAALQERDLANATTGELREVASLIRSIQSLENMRETVDLVGKILLPAALPGVLRWANGAVDLRENVRLFHEVVIGDALPERPGVPEDGVARRRLRLIAEEFFEAMRAAFVNATPMLVTDMAEAEELVLGIIADGTLNFDLAEFADGLADLEYVCEGAFLGFGIDSRPVHAEVQRSNLSKVGGPVRHDGKRMKGPNYSPPDIVSIIKKQMEFAEG